MTTEPLILHATDFSPCSQRALDVASSLARDRNARLIVLHVAPTPISSLGGTQAVPPHPEEYARAELEAQLQAVSAPGLGLRLERKLLFGDPAALIVREAWESGCDLIVLGTHGRTGLARLLAGSVAEHVLRHAPCPVLTVRHLT